MLDKNISSYIEATGQSDRITALKKLRRRGSSLPLSFVDDLYCLELSDNEKNELLRAADRSDRCRFCWFATRV